MKYLCTLVLALAACAPTETSSIPREVDSCFVGGCSNQLCSEDPELASTCEWRDEYACYQTATCGRAADGTCGWIETPALAACLESPPSE